MASASVVNPCTKLVAYSLGWHNWLQDINTNTGAVLRPTSDDDLKKILKSAKSNKCAVRTQGGAHSQDGVARQTREQNVVAISLADDIVSNSVWQDKVSLANSNIRIGAGKTFYDVIKNWAGTIINKNI